MQHTIHVVKIGEDRWIAWDNDPEVDYIESGDSGMAAIGDLVSHSFQHYNLNFSFPMLDLSPYNKEYYE